MFGDVQYWSKVYDIGRFHEPLLKCILLPFVQTLIKFYENFSKDRLKYLLLNAFFQNRVKFSSLEDIVVFMKKGNFDRRPLPYPYLKSYWTDQLKNLITHRTHFNKTPFQVSVESVH